MKKIITIIILLIAGITNAQLVVDDFKTGTINKKTYTTGSGIVSTQKGNGIVKGIRSINAKIRQNPNDHGMELSIKNGLLTMSYGYDTRGTTFVNYGVDKNGENMPMNLNLKDYKTLKVEFEAKSTINGININMFTGNRYAAYGDHVRAREGKFVKEIPLKDLRPTHKDFTLSDIDYIRFQFDSRSKTGCNMAINKIWFE
ncbi:hypothetical protein [Spongiivirga citrea]|uniref:Uncharacterized protein n=1 Tax=Spongiivirga citrea TaxID=1481457 RepID=A0A6M0CL62_9FLAO|nr:hypothetical protein [Spongiivirga citrea]NER18695.1 hypothetical protein [Spongiivirga citrea]